MLIYKIFRASEWQALDAAGETLGAPVDLADGFIHFSTAEQAVETAARHFAGAADLTLAAVEAGALGPALRWEPSRGGALFPHLYAPLRREAVAWAAPLPLYEGAQLFPEPVSGYVNPGRAQFDAFKALDREGPVEMLNLVRLRDRAAYPEDHPRAGEGLTGAEGYALYGAEAGRVFRRLGGAIAWRGSFAATLIGPEAEAWDHVFVARYPSAHAFLAMLADPDYRAAVVHRTASVATSRLIRCAPAEPGEVFG